MGDISIGPWPLQAAIYPEFSATRYCGAAGKHLGEGGGGGGGGGARAGERLGGGLLRRRPDGGPAPPPPEKTSGPSSNSTGGSSCYRLIADPFESPRPKGGDGGPDFAPLGKHRKYRLYSRKTD